MPSTRLLAGFHWAGGHAHSSSQWPKLNSALIYARLMLAHAKVKGMQALTATTLPPTAIWNQKVSSQIKNVKVQALGWMVVIDRFPFCLFCNSFPSSLFIFTSAMSRLSGMVWNQPPLMECYYVFLLCIWPEADCTYFPRSCVHLSLTFIAFYPAFVCACVCVCEPVFLFLCNIMAGISSAILDFSNIWPIHPDAVDICDTNAYFPLSIMTCGK